MCFHSTRTHYMSDVLPLYKNPLHEWCASTLQEPITWVMCLYSTGTHYMSDVLPLYKNPLHEWCASTLQEPITWVMCFHSARIHYMSDVLPLYKNPLHEWCVCTLQEPITWVMCLYSTRTHYMSDVLPLYKNPLHEWCASTLQEPITWVMCFHSARIHYMSDGLPLYKNPLHEWCASRLHSHKPELVSLWNNFNRGCSLLLFHSCQLNDQTVGNQGHCFLFPLGTLICSSWMRLNSLNRLNIESPLSPDLHTLIWSVGGYLNEKASYFISIDYFQMLCGESEPWTLHMLLTVWALNQLACVWFPKSHCNAMRIIALFCITKQWTRIPSLCHSHYCAVLLNQTMDKDTEPLSLSLLSCSALPNNGQCF